MKHLGFLPFFLFLKSEDDHTALTAFILMCIYIYIQFHFLSCTEFVVCTSVIVSVNMRRRHFAVRRSSSSREGSSCCFSFCAVTRVLDLMLVLERKERFRGAFFGSGVFSLLFLKIYIYFQYLSSGSLIALMKICCGYRTRLL